MLEIRELEESDLPSLVEAYNRSSAEYSKHFTPFPFEVAALTKILRSKQRDLYYAVTVDGSVVGLYILRGFDEGYETPSYGIWIAEECAGRGLALSALRHAVSISQNLGCNELMVRIHPTNQRALQLHQRFGFQTRGADQRSGRLIMILPLSQEEGYE